jgi:hypothetical protein
MVTDADPEELAAFFSVETDRLPVRSGSEVVMVVSVERRYLVVDGSAVAVPELPVVSVTLKLVPAIALAGGLLMLLTTRSGEEAWPASAVEILNGFVGLPVSSKIRIKISTSTLIKIAPAAD